MLHPAHHNHLVTRYRTTTMATEAKPLLASLAEAGVIGAMAHLVGATLAEVAVLMACWTIIVWSKS